MSAPRLSDLLHLEAFDADGRHVGHVHDVRLVQDGPLQGLVGQAFRVDGLLVGGSAAAVRLGFHRKNVTGPWPLTAIFHRLERRIRYVPWHQVAGWDDEQLHLSCRADELGPLPPPEADAPGG